MRVAVFDLDGTLADTSADLIAAANATLSQPALRPGPDRALSLQGGRVMLTEGLTRLGQDAGPDRVVALLPEFLAHYEAGIDRESHLFDGVVPTLDRLDADGWTSAVCTNKPARLAEILLTRLGVRDRFAALLGSDSLPVRKPDPAHVLETIARAGGSADRAVMIGDSRTDRDAARNAGIPCVLVSMGQGRAPVEALSPEGIVDRFAQLPGLLGSLIRA